MLARLAQRRQQEVMTAEVAALDAIRDEIPQDGIVQSPVTRATVLRFIDPHGAARRVGTGGQGTSYPRPSLHLLACAYLELSVRTAPPVRDEVCTFLGETLLPMAAVAVQSSPRQATLALGVSPTACASAEGHFLDTYQQSVRGRQLGQSRISVYHDETGQPLALRKSEKESSALALTDLNEFIPAGTIMRVHAEALPQTGEHEGMLCNYNTYEVDGPLAVTPSRLSAWAYPEHVDRAMFAVHSSGRGYNEKRADMIVPFTMDHFRQAAEHVMTLCGIAGQVTMPA